jgi:hypothetical protein
MTAFPSQAALSLVSDRGAWVPSTLLLLFFGLSAQAAPPEITGELHCQPAALDLYHLRQPHSLLVSSTAADGLTIDLTSSAVFESGDPQIAAVDAFGWVQPVKSGKTTITVRAAGKATTVPVVVRLDARPAWPASTSFRHEVMPVFSRAGCNSGACHGYSQGKNGFKLSLRGGDEAADHEAITQEFLGRRINLQRPEASLLLRKPLGEVPHRGGIRLERGDLLHQTLLQWLRDGAPRDRDESLRLLSLRVFPETIIVKPGMQQPLQVQATYSDGSVRDVTRLAVYSSNNDDVARVDELGMVTTRELGETAVVVRYERLFAVAGVVALKPVNGFTATPVPGDNLIDRHVVTKLNALQITPSELCDDAEYLRRVFIDLIGIQPKPEEVKAFLADPAPDKRARVVDALLARPEFVDHWSLKWGDLMQNNRNRIGEPAMKAFHEWLRQAVAENRPLDEFARQLLTAGGDGMQSPPASYFALSNDAEHTVERVTQVFCGVRMLCAKCHHHPFENWTQADYYGLVGFFNQVTVKADPSDKARRAKLVELNLGAAFAVNPRTNARQAPRFLGGSEPPLDARADRREAYARWLTAPDNPYFARSLTNRIWSYFFHRGIIDPVDDLRNTNPPINGPLLEALTKDFVANQFDARHLMRTIVTSRTYQRSTRAAGTIAGDTLNFSRTIPRRLKAEVVLDCLAQATGVPESFPGYPAGTRAAQLPDPVLAPAAGSLLALFGKPQRLEACECERSDESNMLQALEFINGKSILERVSRPNSRVDALLKQKLTEPQLIEELYWWALCRPPSAQEIEIGRAHFQSYGAQRAEAAQDLMWTLLNTKEFLFNR